MYGYAFDAIFKRYGFECGWLSGRDAPFLRRDKLKRAPTLRVFSAKGDPDVLGDFVALGQVGDAIGGAEG